MTTGCGRRCAFCLPDLNPRISVPKDQIMDGRARQRRGGNKQISLATEDMFIWRTDEAGLPFFFPNREALLDLYPQHRRVRPASSSHAVATRRSRRRSSIRI